MKVHAQFVDGPFKGLVATLFLPEDGIEFRSVRLAGAGYEDGDQEVIAAEYRPLTVEGRHSQRNLLGFLGSYEFVANVTSARSLVDYWVTGEW